MWDDAMKKVIYIFRMETPSNHCIQLITVYVDSWSTAYFVQVCRSQKEVEEEIIS